AFDLPCFVAVDFVCLGPHDGARSNQGLVARRAALKCENAEGFLGSCRRSIRHTVGQPRFATSPPTRIGKQARSRHG
ncbi:MAG: hypothetical protein J6D25_04835, partial [Eggerthellaceae bacterium]|nr:hypothetical protein [Eggerthellaceae bacterium]